ncbi:hypothetical protein KKG51_02230, partial [Patescibacteria group bacterium]|nr:hypothetical protein [Patescibacteria group bacterium]
SVATIFLWIFHPFMIKYILDPAISSHKILSSIYVYVGFVMLFGVIKFMKNLAKRSFLQFKETGGFWVMTFLMPFLALFTIAAEMFFFDLYKENWLLISVLVLVLFVYLFVEYRNYRREKDD